MKPAPRIIRTHGRVLPSLALKQDNYNLFAWVPRHTKNTYLQAFKIHSNILKTSPKQSLYVTIQCSVIDTTIQISRHSKTKAKFSSHECILNDFYFTPNKHTLNYVKTYHYFSNHSTTSTCTITQHYVSIHQVIT